MSPFFLAKASGSPYERGNQIGRQSRQRIRTLIEAEFAYYQTHHAETADQVLGNARQYDPFIQEFSPKAFAEIEGMAAGVGCQVAEIVMLNSVFELMAARNPLVLPPGGILTDGCTAFAATAAATKEGVTLVGQNLDGRCDPWHKIYHDFDYLRQIETEEGLQYITYAHSGLLALAGMNSYGIGLCMNNLHAGRYQKGVPYAIIAKEMLEQTTLEEAIAVLHRARRPGSLNFLLGDSAGRLVDIEAMPEDLELMWADTITVHTNHFVSGRLREKLEFDVGLQPWSNSCQRRERVLTMLQTQFGQIEVDTLKNVCRDHAAYPGSVCAHGNPALPADQQARTFAGMVFDLVAGKAHFVKGWPCENEFVTYDL